MHVRSIYNANNNPICKTSMFLNSQPYSKTLVRRQEIRILQTKSGYNLNSSTSYNHFQTHLRGESAFRHLKKSIFLLL